MTKEDLIRKLTSRKFWVALVAFVTSLLVGFKVADSDIAEVASIIMAAGALIAYIFSEVVPANNGDAIYLHSDNTITNSLTSPDPNPDPGTSAA